MGAPFRFDRAWRFDLPVEELWSALANTRAYPQIFSWLDDYEAGPLAAGTVATFRVRPPLPYSLRLVVTIVDVVECERVRTRVGGDVQGPAELAVAPTAGGSQARLSWDLELVHPTLTRIEPLVRRPMIWGHDVVVAMGIRQFRRKALGRG